MNLEICYIIKDKCNRFKVVGILKAEDFYKQNYDEEYQEKFELADIAKHFIRPICTFLYTKSVINFLYSKRFPKWIRGKIPLQTNRYTVADIIELKGATVIAELYLKIKK